MSNAYPMDNVVALRKALRKMWQINTRFDLGTWDNGVIPESDTKLHRLWMDAQTVEDFVSMVDSGDYDDKDGE